MSDSLDHSVKPVAPVAGSQSVQPVRPEPPQPIIARSATPDRKPDVAASTSGSLPPAYSQFVVNQDTHDVVIRIRDAATDQVLAEYPSQQVEEIAAYMKTYAETLARHRAALHKGNG